MFEVKLKKRSDGENAWLQLEAAGLPPLYSIEEGGELFFYLETLPASERFSFIEAVSEKEAASVDWEEQWRLHGTERFEAGGETLYLKPGGGFGDLSHPTTRLMLKMMPGLVEEKRVADIGCGSGVLAIAAAAMGASTVSACDISSEALEHARENAALNRFQQRISFTRPSCCDLVLMNMIRSEQEKAWEGLEALHALTSGIRLEKREEYLIWMRGRGWQLLGEEREAGWCAFFLGGEA